MGIGFAADTCFTELELPLIMGFAGLFLVLINHLTGSVILAWIPLFISLMTNTLAEGKYYDESLLIIGPAFLFSLICLTLPACFFRLIAKRSSRT